MTAADKKFYGHFLHLTSCEEGSGNMGNQNQDLHALSTPQTFVGSPLAGSPIFGPNSIPTVFVRTISGSSHHSVECGAQLCDTISNKTLFYLISTLNESFSPDYDFSDAKSDEFSREPGLKWVKDSIHSNMSAVLGDEFAVLEASLWKNADEEIKLGDCEIYRWDYNLIIMVMYCVLLNCAALK